MTRSRGRARRFLIFGLVVAGAAGAAAGYVHWFRTHRLLAVTEGQLYRSGELPLETLRSEVQRYGIRTVVDFRQDLDKAEAERKALQGLGVRYFHLPSGQVPTPGSVETFLEILDRSGTRPVLIHCEHGIGRTGVFAAIYRMEYEGWQNGRARREAMWISGLESFHADSSKGRFLSAYVPRQRRGRH
jgi:protein tyrosine/serine phosphatase